MKRVKNLFLLFVLVLASNMTFAQVVKLEKNQLNKMHLSSKRLNNLEKRDGNKNAKSQIEPFNVQMIKREEIIIRDSEK